MVGVVLLVAITVILAAGAEAFVFGASEQTGPAAPTPDPESGLDTALVHSY